MTSSGCAYFVRKSSGKRKRAEESFWQCLLAHDLITQSQEWCAASSLRVLVPRVSGICGEREVDITPAQ